MQNVIGWTVALVLLVAAGIAWLPILDGGTKQQRRVADTAWSMAKGDPERGRQRILEAGCGACHTISGIASARGMVGPPLTDIGTRALVAGMLENTPENLARWIENPRAVNPKTAMPVLGLDQAASSDIAAYLYSLSDWPRIR